MLTFAELARGLFHCLLLNGAALASAILLGRRFFPRRYLAERFQVAALLWSALVALPCLVLGALGVLTRGTLLGVEVGIFAGAFLAWRGFGPRPLVAAGRPGPFAWGMAVLFGVVGLAFAVPALTRPPLSWDSLYYHLPVAAEWLQSGSLGPLYHSTAPHHGYFPATGDLFTLWALLPFGNDLCVGLVGFPFLALGGVAVYRIAILCGAEPHLARYAAPLYLLTPAVARYAGTQYVEPMTSAFALSAAVHLLEYRREERSDAVLLFGLALGLLAGTKSTALVQAAMLVLPMAWILARRRARGVGVWRLSGAAALALCGGFWYVRNLILTGNPFYPNEVSLFGISLFEGVPHRSMGMALDSGYRIAHGIWDGLAAGESLSALLGSAEPDAFELGLGPKLLPLAVCVLAVAVWLLRRGERQRRPDLALALGLCAAFTLAFLATPLWRAAWLPVNVRFAAPALGLAVAAAAAAAQAARVSEPRLALCAALCAVPDLVVLLSEAGGATRLAWAAALCAPALWAIAPARHPSRWRAWAALPAGLALAGLLLLGASALHEHREGSRHEHYAKGWDLHRAYLAPYASAWRWLDEHVRGSQRVAHHGVEYLYPLYGPRLERRVRYVDVNARDGGAHHAYPLGQYREHPDPERWIANLRRREIRWVVVTRPWYERSFPVEADWAQAHPRMFRPAFRSAHARIYEIVGGPT
jgi:hypothetical protein